MQILVADETNNVPDDDVEFFIYGGVVFDTETVKAIGDGVKSIREKYKISPDEKLKFNIRSCPKTLSQKEHTSIKNDILDLANDNNVTLIINLVLHDIAKNKTKNELVEMTSTTVFRRFNEYCHEKQTAGIVLADQWPCDKGFEFLERCQNDTITYSSGHQIKLPWIYGYAQTSDNSTPLMSVADIILGGFRYCINHRDRTNVNSTLIPKIANLLWHEKNSNNQRYIWHKGLNTSPRKVDYLPYKTKYNELHEHILKYANQNN